VPGSKQHQRGSFERSQVGSHSLGIVAGAGTVRACDEDGQ
jgi:hypothetical protein